MNTAPSRSQPAQRHFRLKRAALNGLGGLALGYLALHPLTMAVFAWFESTGADSGLTMVIHGIAESFSSGMAPMGTVFALFGLVLGATDGYYRSVVTYQRNELSDQLRVNTGYRFELERTVGRLERQNRRLSDLELGRRRTTRFLAHDLKNHLGCVLGGAELLAESPAGSERSARELELLRLLDRQASRMASAVENLLDLARLEDSPSLRRQQTRVATLFESVIDSVALLPGDARLTINPALDPSITTDCDFPLVVRALSNLVQNAAKHNHPGVLVILGARRLSRTTLFECRDDGAGIPEAITGTLFDEFCTAGNREHGRPSHGLGLAFCKAAVEAHGGRIWFDTHPGRGTSFLFTIPDQEADA